MRFIFAIIFVLIVGIFAGLAVIYSGVYNVAASQKDPPVVKWLLEKTAERSVKRHAKDIVAPSLTDSALISRGFREYDQRCAGCHGAPGVSRRDMSRGLNPEPPSLVTVLDEWTPAELFWITKNGIRMTGMPGFGHVRSDDELWSIVAFLRTLPDMEPDEYLSRREAVRTVATADTTRRP